MATRSRCVKRMKQNLLCYNEKSLTVAAPEICEICFQLGSCLATWRDNHEIQSQDSSIMLNQRDPSSWLLIVIGIDVLDLSV